MKAPRAFVESQLPAVAMWLAFSAGRSALSRALPVYLGRVGGADRSPAVTARTHGGRGAQLDARALAVGLGVGVVAGASFAFVMGRVLSFGWLEQLRVGVGCGVTGASWSMSSFALVRCSTAGGAQKVGRLILSSTLLCLVSLGLVWGLP